MSKVKGDEFVKSGLVQGAEIGAAVGAVGTPGVAVVAGAGIGSSIYDIITHGGNLCNIGQLAASVGAGAIGAVGAAGEGSHVDTPTDNTEQDTSNTDDNTDDNTNPAPIESGIPLWLLKALAQVLQDDEYLTVTRIDPDADFSLVFDEATKGFKPGGAKTLEGFGLGLRLVKINGKVGLVVSDLDVAFLVKGGKFVGNADFLSNFLPKLNEAARPALAQALGMDPASLQSTNPIEYYDFIQHGGKASGAGLLDENGQPLNPKGAETFNEQTYVLNNKGFVDSGPMWKMLHQYAPAWPRYWP